MKNIRSLITPLILLFSLGMTFSALGAKTYYSVANGPASSNIWSFSSTGTPGPLIGNGNFLSMVVQTGFVVQQDMNLELKDLTIENGGSFIVQGSQTLEMTGNWQNDGTYLPSNGRVFLNGLAAQFMSGLSTSEFYDLEFSSKVSVSISSPVNVINILDLTQGNLYTGNKLTFISNSSGTGVFYEVSGNIFGRVTAQRYHDAQAQDWVMLASPLTNCTADDWNDNIITTGFTGSDYPTYNFNNVLTYDETVIGTDDDGFVGLTNISEPLENGKGYFVYTQQGAFTLDMMGRLMKGTVSFPITYTSTGDPTHDGWNLVANPYQCTIDWDMASGWTRTGTNNAVHVYDAANGIYATYINGVGNNGGSPLIAPGQAFWIQSNTSAPTLSCDESVKSRSLGVFKDGSTQNIFQISLAADGSNDQVTLVQNPQASTNFDALYDGGKLIATDGIPAIFSKSDDDYDLAINALPTALEAITIPIYISGTSTSDHVISWDASGQFYASSCLSLIDQMTGISHSINLEGELTFSHDPEFEGPRFVITVGQTAMPAIETVTCHGMADGKLTIAPQSMTDVLVVDPEGQVILSTLLDYSEVTLENLNSGLYTVNMSEHDGCSDLSFDVFIDQPAPVIADFNCAVSTYALLDGQAHVDFQNLSEGATNYEWNFGDHSLVSVSENPTHTFDTTGEFTITLNASDEDCKSSISKEIIIIEDHSTAVSELYEQGQIAVWMTQDEIHVEFNLDMPSTYRICAYNILGQKLTQPVHQEFENQRVTLPCNASYALVEIYDTNRNERYSIQVVY